MIAIPSNIAFFILGFISCAAFIIVWVIHTVKREESKRKEVINSYIKLFTEQDKKNIENDKEK